MKIIGLLFLTVAIAFGDDALQQLQQGNLKFSASLYRELIKENQGNMILSPLSVQIVLALTQLGAKGETALELTKGLHLPETPEKVREAFKALLPKLKGNQFYSLSSANKVYIKDGVPINPEFQKQSQEIFDAGLENINFVENVKAAATINKWVESQTNDKIKDLIDPSKLDALTRMVLINAVYFKANWSTPFESYETTKRKFYKSEKEEIEVETMHLTENLRFAENKDLDAKFVELPYEGGDVTFTIALPNKKEGLKALEEHMEHVLSPQNYSLERISLYMPRFKIDSKFDLVKPLKNLGIKKPFEDADFSGLLANTEPLVISDVLQKAFINVTESGTEAAAATAVGISFASAIIPPPHPPRELRVEHPFLYAITVKNGGTVFIGRVKEPSA